MRNRSDIKSFYEETILLKIGQEIIKLISEGNYWDPKGKKNFTVKIKMVHICGFF